MERTVKYGLLVLLVILLAGSYGCRNPFFPRVEPPYVVIVKPPAPPGGGIETLAQIVTFAWESGLENDPRYVRYMYSKVIDTAGVYDPTFNIVEDLNENPWRYEHMWTPWISYSAPGDSGRATVLGDDEILEIGKMYIFAVQAKGISGAVTKEFVRGRNLRQFIVTVASGPLLTVMEPFLGYYKFLGTSTPPPSIDLPPAVPLNFRWHGDASDYGGEIASYRYGWDIQDLNDPSQWDVAPSPYNIQAPQKKLYSGTHAFYVETVDNIGIVTLAQFVISIIPCGMERNLLWVDDFYSTDFQQISYAMPTETEHDDFWLDICSRADGFEPSSDVYDCAEHSLQLPSISYMGGYKNIIWTYSASYDTWSDMVVFTPESQVGMGTQDVNYLSIFLVTGGHIWTLGRSEQNSGLAANFPQPAAFPASFRFDMASDPSDTSGVFCMGYKDYCVSVVDKVWGVFRSGEDMPPGVVRNMDRDAMRFAYRDLFDPVTAMHPELPESLQLWEEVTAPGRFFDPAVRGFTYVEVYDPDYYMYWMYLSSQSCFHPMYRMKTRNSLSVLSNGAVALWLTKYEEVVPIVESGIAVAAPSVHFGLPLWFFDRDDVDQIVDVIFDEWQINTAR